MSLSPESFMKPQLPKLSLNTKNLEDIYEVRCSSSASPQKSPP